MQQNLVWRWLHKGVKKVMSPNLSQGNLGTLVYIHEVRKVVLLPLIQRCKWLLKRHYVNCGIEWASHSSLVGCRSGSCGKKGFEFLSAVRGHPYAQILLHKVILLPLYLQRKVHFLQVCCKCADYQIVMLITLTFMTPKVKAIVPEKKISQAVLKEETKGYQVTSRTGLQTQG